MAGFSGDLTALIGSQAGMLARWQAREHGVPDHALRDLLSRRCWFVRSPGVYATFAGPLGRPAELWAALLHCSHRPRRLPGVTHLPDAVLSHETAAELYGFGARLDRPIHVTIPSGRRCPKRLPDIAIHFSGRLEQSRHPALWPPRTRVADTVIDLTQSAVDTETAVEWLAQACARHVTTPTDLAGALAARPRVRRRAELSQSLSKGAPDLLETSTTETPNAPTACLPASAAQDVLVRSPKHPRRICGSGAG